MHFDRSSNSERKKKIWMINFYLNSFGLFHIKQHRLNLLLVKLYKHLCTQSTVAKWSEERNNKNQQRREKAQHTIFANAYTKTLVIFFLWKNQRRRLKHTEPKYKINSICSLETLYGNWKCWVRKRECNARLPILGRSNEHSIWSLCCARNAHS